MRRVISLAVFVRSMGRPSLRGGWRYFPLFTRALWKGCRVALPLGRVREVHETSRISPHHSGAALPAERDAQVRFLNGGI